LGSPTGDQLVSKKQWAAEDYAITVGLLRECPYHGEPFKARRASTALVGSKIDPLDPAVRVFNGNMRELLAAVERVTGHYGERCQYCAASDQETFD
jgi:hypothetical protein